MKIDTDIVQSTAAAFGLTLLLVAGLSTETFARDVSGIRPHPRIGLKSTAVLKNDLKQIGLPNANITLRGGVATARIPVQGQMADVEIDRKTGVLRVIKASPQVRQILLRRVPKVQLQMAPGLQAPIRQDPGIKLINPGAIKKN